MQIGILTVQSRQFQSYDHVEALAAAARVLGHEVDIIYAEDLSVQLLSEKTPVLLYQGLPLPAFDLMLVRARIIGDPAMPYTIFQLLEAQGTLCLNSAHARFLASNKVATLVELQRKRVPMVPAHVVYTVEEAARAAKTIGYPCIVKVPYGSRGTGVFLAESSQTLRPLVDFLFSRGFEDPVLIQPYVRTAKADVRALVLGSRVLVAASRIAHPEDFRSNSYQGGVMTTYTLTPAQERVAIRAAQAVGADIAGVDLLITRRGAQVLEVNTNPHFEGLAHATGVNVAQAIVQFAVRKAQRHNRLR